MSNWNDQIIEEFRANDGKVGGPFEGAPMLLLTTTGAKSGKQHTTPLVFLPDGDRWIIFASAAGAPKHPAWYHNLVAHPNVTVEVGKERLAATATVLTSPEREEKYASIVKLMPNFAEYQAKTTRQIPVIALKR